MSLEREGAGPGGDRPLSASGAGPGGPLGRGRPAWEFWRAGEMGRRDVLCGAAAGAAALGAGRPAGAAKPSETPIVDTNVSLFQWPCRRLPLDEPRLLAERLRALGVTQAWAGSFEGLLHRDVAAVNQRLAEACRLFPQLVPVGTVNLSLPDWREDVRRCREVWQMSVIRLHPNYHGHELTDPRFAQLLELAAAAGLTVQLAVALEDRRTQHPLLHVPEVPLAPLPRLLARIPRVRVQLLNWRPTSELAEALAAREVRFDTARVEGTDGVARLIAQVGLRRVLLGSHAPFLIPEAALIRVAEAGLSVADRAAVLGGNAASWRSRGQ